MVKFEEFPQINKEAKLYKELSKSKVRPWDPYSQITKKENVALGKSFTPKYYKLNPHMFHWRIR